MVIVSMALGLLAFGFMVMVSIGLEFLSLGFMVLVPMELGLKGIHCKFGGPFMYGGQPFVILDCNNPGSKPVCVTGPIACSGLGLGCRTGPIGIEVGGGSVVGLSQFI